MKMSSAIVKEDLTSAIKTLIVPLVQSLSQRIEKYFAVPLVSGKMKS